MGLQVWRLAGTGRADAPSVKTIGVKGGIDHPPINLQPEPESELNLATGFVQLLLSDRNADADALWAETSARAADTTRLREVLVIKAQGLEREIGSISALDWKLLASYYRTCGEAYFYGGRNTPKYMERAADAIFASGDVSHQNGDDSIAARRYQRAIDAYDELLALVGPDSQQFSRRVLRKRKEAEDELSSIELVSPQIPLRKNEA